ncbi:MAG: zf-HC2 domain-containing protein [Pyrinomonadaceae bacterium]
MNCKEFREQLDALVDGELSADSEGEAREHLKTCEACSKLEARLRRLRSSLKRVVKQHQPPPELEGEVLRSLRSRGHHTHGTGVRAIDESRRDGTPVWRAKVSVPLPFFAMLLLSVVALVGWLVFARGPAREEVSTSRAVPFATPAPPQESPGGFDFSRYYNGGRASVQVVRRASLDGPGR